MTVTLNMGLHTKVKSSLVLLALLLLLTGGCNQNGKNKKTIISDEEVIAVVNNKKISLKRFQSRLQNFLNHYNYLIQNRETHLSKIKTIVINRMVEEELVLQEAARAGLRVTQKELNASVEAALSPYPQAGFTKILAQKGTNKKDWVESLRINLLTLKILEHEMEKIPVTKREISRYYKDNKKKLVTPKAIRVKNITLATESEAQTIRNEIIRKRKIDKLIQEYSISPDRDASGDMGYIEKDELPFELEQAIFKLSWQNKISKVVHSQDGYHIFYWVKTRWRNKPSEKEASNQIKEAIRGEKQDQFYSNWIKLLKQKATIQIDQAMLKSEEGF